MTPTTTPPLSSPIPAPAPQKDDLVGIKGWLMLFLIGLVLAIGLNLYGAISGFADTSINDPEVLAMFPNLPAVVTFENICLLLLACLGTYVFIMVIKRLKKAQLVAKIYLISAIVFTFIDIAIVYSLFKDNQTALDAAFQGSGYARGIMGSTLWLWYIMTSKRVKATLTREPNQTVPLTQDNPVVFK